MGIQNQKDNFWSITFGNNNNNNNNFTDKEPGLSSSYFEIPGRKLRDLT
jgi:hypothetical protein